MKLALHLLCLAGLLSASPLAAVPTQGTLPEWGRPLTPAEGRELRQTVAQLSVRLGVSERTLHAVARAVGADSRILDFRELIRRIEILAGQASELQSRIGMLEAQLAALPDAAGDPAERALARATAAFNEGRLDDAEREFAALESLRLVDSTGAHQAWADAVEVRATIAELQLNYDGAEALRLAAVEEEQRRIGASKERQWQFTMDAARSRFNQGDQLGDNAALERAIELYRDRALPLAPRAEREVAWADTQLALGDALWLLGSREGTKARLEQALEAYRAALEAWPRERAPFDWALIQSRLGNVLSALGQREDGTERLEQAVSAYEAALEVQTRAVWPDSRSVTLNNLGEALRRIAGREQGTARLEAAARAFREALELVGEPGSRGWRSTQTNLGLTLMALGQLEEAVTVLQAALDGLRQDRMPLDWAAAQHDLGLALLALGRRQGDRARLERAVGALEAALREHRRDRVPLEWAANQNSLGSALWALGEMETGTARLEQAARAYESALLEWTRDRAAFRWAGTTANLANVAALISGRTGDRAGLARAERQAREAREVMAAEAPGAGLAWADHVLAEIASIRRRMRR